MKRLLHRLLRGFPSPFTLHSSRGRSRGLRPRGFPSPFTHNPSPFRPYGFRLRRGSTSPITHHPSPNWGKLGFSACVGVILLMSIGIQPKIGITVPAKSVPFSSSMISKNSLLFDLRRDGFIILENLMGPGFDNTEMRDFLENAITGMGNCNWVPECNGKSGLLDGAGQSSCLFGAGCGWGIPQWACACDLNADGHFFYYDTAAFRPGYNACGNCPPEFELIPFTANHSTCDTNNDGLFTDNCGHLNEPHVDAKITLHDVYFELRACALCFECNAPVQMPNFPILLVINPNKVDVNKLPTVAGKERTDDPVITIAIESVSVDLTGELTNLCGSGLNCNLDDLEGLVAPMLEEPLKDAIQSQFLGFLPMDMNAMLASEAAYACPTYSGTAKNPWCTNGVQNDPTMDGYGYCKDIDEDGMIEVNAPAYRADIGESPPTTYGTLACGDALINMGVYPHLQISNPDNVRSADDRLTMNMDLGCEVQEAAPDIDKTRIDVQDKLCKPGPPWPAGCNGTVCDTTTCSPYPTCCAAASYPRCCSLSQPTNPNGFACSVGQDVGNQITNAIAQSGLISCEISKDGLKTGLPIPMPLDMSQFLKVESFANLIPPIDDQADPGSYVKIKWRPYGDGNVATKEVCAAIGGEPGSAYACSALCKENIPANAVYCADPLNCCYPAGPVDINFSFRNIYTDFFIQVGGDPDTKAFGVSMDVGGALDMEFKTALQGNRVFANKAAFLAAGCNPFAGGTVDCLKVAIDPLDLMNVQFRYQDMDPTYLLNQASLEAAFPDVLVNLMGGAAQAWVETQIQLAGLGFNMLTAGPDTCAPFGLGCPDLDGNLKADYLTCSGNFAGSFDLIKLLSLLTGGAGGGDNPCAVENPKAYARLAGSDSRAGSGQDGRPGRHAGALSSSSRATGDWRLATPLGGPETFIIHPFTGNPEASFQFVAEESRRASLIPEKPVRLQLYSVGSGVINYTWRLDRGVWRMTTEPVIQLPYLLEGTHQLEVQAVDGTGLADPSPAKFVFQIDTQPPKINLFGLTAYANMTLPGEDPVYFVDSNVLRVEVSDFQTPFTHIKASYFLDGKEVKMTEPKMEIDPSKLSREQEHVLSVRATDVSGLESTREMRFTFRKEVEPPEDENFFGCESIPRPRVR